MKNIFHSVRGTSDFYPPAAFYFEDLTQKARKIFKIFGYEPLILPHLEERGLFKKGIGEATDVVEKQMFKIEGKDIVLRPEGTAQVVRFYLERNLYKHRDFCKFYYVGSMFRGERPQKGRLREFNHIGAEAIGSKNIYLDAEIIELASRIIKEAGIKTYVLRINSLGCSKDKLRLAELIKNKLSSYISMLCDDCKKRISRNPLRVLDCKKSGCKKIVNSLKIKDDHLCGDCREAFYKLLNLLDDMRVSYLYDPFLVRGLDYYTNMVFEISSSSLGSQDAIGAGGRYNDLIKRLGGIDMPAVGFALGLERMMLLLSTTDQLPSADVLVAYTSASVYNEAYKILRSLREHKISSVIDYREKSLKAQLKLAQKLNIPLVAIVGDEEIKRSRIIVRDMIASLQEEVELNNLIAFLKERIGKDV